MAKKTSLNGAEKLLYFLNIVLSLLLLASYLIPFVSPDKAPKIAVLSLLFPLLYVGNLLFLVYWLLKAKRQIILSLTVAIVGLSYFSSLVKFDSKEIIQSRDIKVMSYNVKMLNHYGWSSDKEIPQKINTFIKDRNPDILVLQEYFQHNSVDFGYPHKVVHMKSKSNIFGLAIFSKYRIVNTGSLDFEDSANNSIFADLLIGSDTIRVYNLHLESLKVNPNEENFGQDTSDKLLGRLATTFKKQASQVDQFVAHESEWDGKSIVAGDFNNTAFSWSYREIKGDKLDAFKEAGAGFSKTFDYAFPLRIDFILCDPGFEVNYYKKFSVSYSDHFPILAHIGRTE